MEKIIFHKCQICGKSAQTVDKRSDIETEVISCDLQNEYQSCYIGKEEGTKEYRFVKKKSNPVKYNFK